MKKQIVLKQHPTIEFQLLDHGFQVIDEQTEGNSGFYPYDEVQSIELHKLWFPRLAQWLRVFTGILNSGIPFFPDADSWKRSKVLIRLKQAKLGMWLTDPSMAAKARLLKAALDQQTNYQQR